MSQPRSARQRMRTTWSNAVTMASSPVPPVRGPHVVQGAFVAQGRARRVHASPSAALASEEVEEVFASDGAIEEVLAVHVNSSTKPNARSPGRESFLCANGDGSDPELAMKEELLLPLFDALWNRRGL